MQASYQTALNLIGKIQGMSRHRALRHDGGTNLATDLNRFIERVVQELETCKVTPGEIVAEEKAQSLQEFLSP